MKNYKTIPGFNDRYEVSETGIVRLTNNPESVPKRFWHKRINSFKRKDGLRVYTLTVMRKRYVITDVRAVGLAHVCPDQSKAFHLDSGKTLHPKNIIALDGIGKNNLYGRRKRKDCTSQYRGVYWHKHSKRFVGAVVLDGKTYSIPGDTDEKVVAERVDRKLDEVCPDAPLSRFNFPDLAKGWRDNRSRLDKCAAVARTKDFEPKYKDRPMRKKSKMSRIPD